MLSRYILVVPFRVPGIRRGGYFQQFCRERYPALCGWTENWLFSDITKGAESSAVVYTLVETAKANGLDPYTYLLQLLTELPYLGRNPSQDDLDLFLPWQPALHLFRNF